MRPLRYKKSGIKKSLYISFLLKTLMNQQTKHNKTQKHTTRTEKQLIIQNRFFIVCNAMSLAQVCLFHPKMGFFCCFFQNKKKYTTDNIYCHCVRHSIGAEVDYGWVRQTQSLLSRNLQFRKKSLEITWYCPLLLYVVAVK